MTRATHRYLLAVLTPLLLASGAGSALAQEPPLKIAVVDVERVITQSTAGKELQSRIEAFRQAAEAEIRTRTTALNELGQRASAAEGAEGARLSKEYEDVAIALKRFQDDKTREGRKLQESGLRDLERQLAPIFRQIRDSEGYDLILARTPGVTLMVGDRLEITQKVIDLFNASG